MDDEQDRFILVLMHGPGYWKNGIYFRYDKTKPCVMCTYVYIYIIITSFGIYEETGNVWYIVMHDPWLMMTCDVWCLMKDEKPWMIFDEWLQCMIKTHDLSCMAQEQQCAKYDVCFSSRMHDDVWEPCVRTTMCDKRLGYIVNSVSFVIPMMYDACWYMITDIKHDMGWMMD